MILILQDVLLQKLTFVEKTTSPRINSANLPHFRKCKAVGIVYIYILEKLDAPCLEPACRLGCTVSLFYISAYYLMKVNL
jgi:hypothetical protein